MDDFAYGMHTPFQKTKAKIYLTEREYLTFAYKVPFLPDHHIRESDQ